MLTAIRRFGNPRYSRFGNLRYAYCTWKSRGPPDINAPHFLLFTFMLWLHCSVVTLMEQMSQLARQAKAAGRVEVPFEFVAPPAEHPNVAAGVPQPRDDDPAERARAAGHQEGRCHVYCL